MLKSAKKPLRRRALFVFLAGLLIFLALGLYSGLTVRYYTVSSERLSAPVRLALLADLHSCRYGMGGQKLLAALEEQKPDAILLAGDIFDDTLPDENAAALLQAIGGEYPCYYVTGNHEFWAGKEQFLRQMAIVEECGVKRLMGAAETVVLQGQELNLCGVDDPYGQRLSWEHSLGLPDQLEQALAQTKAGCFTVLLAHRPEAFELYSRYDFDLAVCGHAHGGQWRIPFLLNGLYAPNQGFFPKYAGGEYRSGGTTMIVSRGLARESTAIPRFYNPPELVIIDLVPAG